ncbi:unnamed protein product, partial [Staurois parvus]
YKRCPHFQAVCAPWGYAAPRSGAHCVLRNADRCTGPLCEVLIM